MTSHSHHSQTMGMAKMTSNILVVWLRSLWYATSYRAHLHLLTNMTQVNIQVTNVPNHSVRFTRAPRPGVHSLPGEIRQTFADNFIPIVIQEMGDSEAPWENLPIDTLQECVDVIYPNLEYVVERGDALVSSVSCSASFVSISSFNKCFSSQTKARMMSFRNIIGNTAVVNVQKFLARYKTPELIEKYIKSGILYHKEIPFLYRVFEPTDVPSSKEKGGYKVVSTDLLLDQASWLLTSSPGPPWTISEPSYPRHHACLFR